MSAPDFDRFARGELPRLVNYAIMLTGDRELAQDLVQDVMVDAHRHWSRIANLERPEGYATRIVTNAFFSWRRKWSVPHIFSAGELPDVAYSDDLTTAADLRDDLWRRLSTLPPRQRAVLVLRYYEFLPDAEIADVLGCSSSTVRGYAHRALAALRLDLTSEVVIDVSEEAR
ncbi:MAG: SigE family RNA polymerase sigma factor [Jatrophihabitans sp.]